MGEAVGGRPSGFAAVGLLQVRAFALIPCGDGARPPCASLARGLRPLTSSIRPVCGRWGRSPRGGSGAPRPGVWVLPSS